MKITENSMAKFKRIMIQLGEYYQDMLTLDAFIAGRTPSAQAGSLLGAKLQEREPKIKERLQYLANKRGVTVEELTASILNGSTDNDDVVDD
jgi:hypothetical protein